MSNFPRAPEEAAPQDDTKLHGEGSRAGMGAGPPLLPGVPALGTPVFERWLSGRQCLHHRPSLVGVPQGSMWSQYRRTCPRPRT